MANMNRFLILLLSLITLSTACITTPDVDDDDDDDSTDAPPLDSDGDGVPDDEDACPDDAEQSTDADEDGVCDELDDACPDDPAQSTDADGDGVCDELDDACLDDIYNWTDADEDGHCDETDDACPEDPLQWTDADGDGYCDEVDDACPEDPAGWEDTDGDGSCSPTDDCPDDPNGWVDSDNDGDCDEDDDTDGDGITDGEENAYGDDCAISNPFIADSDGDGISDNDDLYPRDPFPEYVLFRNDLGTIDIILSNRDGTFTPATEIGTPFGGTTNGAYRYTTFVISDFDNNGRTDFLAIGDADPSDSSNPLDLWWFGRVSGPTAFSQRLVDDNLDANILYTVADVDNDEDVDLVRLFRNQGGNVTSAIVRTYLNQGTIDSAECAWTDDPANPNGCAFVRVEGINLNSFAVGQWIVSMSRDAVDVDGDGNRDLLSYTHSSGGNSSCPIMLLQGNGDGTFNLSAHDLFTHNSPGSGQSPVNSIVFADFDNDLLGDIIIGLDDDGDAGSAWFYQGSYSPTNGYYVDPATSFESFDLNPGAESGGENYGVTNSARPFDFDFDGNQDILLGYNYQSPWAAPSETLFLPGQGNGSFGTPTLVRDFPNSRFAGTLKLPQRLCRRFPIGP